MITWCSIKHSAALNTDSAWQAELARQFGKAAGDVRYTERGKGDEGSQLRELHDARMKAQAEWHATIEH